MGSLWRAAVRPRSEAREITTIDDYVEAVANALGGYGDASSVVPYGGLNDTYKRQYIEQVPQDLQGYARALFAGNDVVFSLMDVRQKVFSAVRFQWQRINNGRPSELFGTPALSILETPYVGGTTQDILARVIQDADLAGNSYHCVIDNELVRLRPDWVQIVLMPRFYNGGQVGWSRLGYLYWEKGIGNDDPVPLLTGEVAHFAPIPDPLAPFRGMSWLTPVLREAQNDKAMNTHKSKFFENAATPNLSVSLAKEVRPDSFKRFVEEMNLGHKGVENAYKTLYLGGGADVKVIGTDFSQMDFSNVQGHGETRIAAAAGVPPIIAGFSEGLASATYSNYGQARRRFADGTMHPLWQNVAGSLATLVPAPGGSAVRLWYDARDVPFLREDRRDAVGIVQTQASTIRQLIETGYEPDAVVRAVTSEDFGLLLGQHSGLTSVQLQPPTDDPNAKIPAPGELTVPGKAANPTQIKGGGEKPKSSTPATGASS
jgi:hypothetical protein